MQVTKTSPTIFGQFIRYASLNVLGMFGISLYILADTFFIANGVGADGLTALNLAVPAYNFLHGCALMLGLGGATRYTVSKSQGKTAHANKFFTHTILLATLFSTFFFCVGLVFAAPLARILGANAEVFDMTYTYLRIILLFAPAFIFNEVFLAFVRNDGAPHLAMYAMVGGSLANILFDYIFIFPLHMGIFGAVLATGCSPLFGMLIQSIYRIRRKNQFHLVRTGLSASLTGSTLALGFSSLVTEVSSGVVMIVFNMLMLRLEGNTAVAAYGVIANLILVVIAIFTGIGQGIQPLISHAYGRGERQHALQYRRYGLFLMAAFSVTIYAGILFSADGITTAFNSEQNPLLQQIAVKGLRIYFAGILFAGFNIVLSFYFTSIEKAVPAQVISLARGLLIIVPLSILLANILGMTGVWMSFPISELLVSFLGLFFLVKQKLGGKHSQNT